MGLNLQRAASGCINLELPWNPAVLEQRISRIYRIGQKQPIDVYNLLTEEGIEARITDLMSNKKALFTGLFDGTSDEIRFDRSGSLLSRIEQLIAPAAGAGAGVHAEEEADIPDKGDEAEEPTEAERQLDKLLQAADESQDGVVEASGAETPPNAVPLAAPAEVPSGNGHAPAAQTQPVAAAAPLSGEAIRRLFAEVKIRPVAGGGLTLEASPTAAATLAALFQGMATLLQEASAP